MSRDTKQLLVDVARDLFVEHGAKGLTMRAVARRAGLTPMAIYRHFRGHEALLQAVVAQGHAKFLQHLQLSLAGKTPWQRFEQSGAAYLRFALENPQDYAVLFLQPAHSRGRKRGSPAWQDAATFRFLVDRIRELAAAGLIVAPDAEAAALTVWAQVHGLVSLHLAGKLQVDERAFRQLYARSLQQLVRGLSPKKRAAKSTVYT